jgi:N6-L-threonylcarbamoyladenine synthase
VRYAVAEKELTADERAAVARDFEDAVTEVLLKKTSNAVTNNGAKTIIVGGGVSANQFIKRAFEKYFLNEFPDVTVYFPAPSLATDNSIMIALAGHARATGALSPDGAEGIQADGNKSL